MAKKNCIPYGSDVSAGEFECADCGYKIKVKSVTSLPPCPKIKKLPHTRKCWKCLSGQGDAPEDPYPAENAYRRLLRKLKKIIQYGK